MKETNVDILKKNRLSLTDSRRKILNLFLENRGALSHGEIEKKLGSTFDRVTIYRTLQTFLDKGIIHDIPTSDNFVHYALCRDNCSTGHHQDHHIHFVCEQCGHTICLDEVTVPTIKLPKGYYGNRMEMVVNGICKDCR
ncbi:MAG: Fur family transcriptional regulator [Chitinophagales bacterium]